MANYNFQAIDSHISHLLDHFNIVRNECMEAIKNLMEGEKEINFKDGDDETFFDLCDRATVTEYWHRSDTATFPDVYSIEPEGVRTEDGLFIAFEDISVQELVGVYNMLAQWREYQATGNITIML